MTRPAVSVQPRKRPTQDRAHRRVAVILDATKALLRDQGLATLTTTRVATQAGIPVSSLYQYFPNKKALLVALFSEYLEQMRSIYLEFDRTTSKKQPGWENYFERQFRSFYAQERHNRLDVELARAVAIHGELQEMDRQHGDWMAMRFAESLRRLGSVWPLAKLKRLALFVYAIDNAVWEMRKTDDTGRVKDILDWQLATSMAVLRQCMP